MKKNLLLFLFYPACGLLAQIPQSAALHAQFDQIGKAQSPSSVPSFDTRHEGVLGTRYTIDTYKNGEIWLTDGHHYTTEFQYRFDEIEQKIQVKYPDGKELLLFNNYVTKCHIFNNDTIIKYQKVVVENEKELHIFYQVLHEGKNFTFLKLPHRKVVRVDEKTALTIGRLYDEIKPVYHYYFKENDKQDTIFRALKLKKKDLLKMLPTKKIKLGALFKAPQYNGDLDEQRCITIFKKLEEQ